MKMTRVLAMVLVAGSLGVTSASAQIQETQPAEFPPASYKGKQYVDSNGCVFVRAGIDGDVAWVPRVSRDRKLVCGFRPSLAAEVAEAPAAEAPAPEPETAPKSPAVATAAPAPAASTPPPRKVAKAPAPKKRAAKPVVVRQTAPKPAPQRRVVAVAPSQPGQRVVQEQVVVARGASACLNASPLSQQYLQGQDVRCGPQTQRILPIKVVSTGGAQAHGTAGQQEVILPVDQINAKPLVVAQNVTATTQIAPKHVVQNRVNTTNVQVPKGYRKVWDDGRLNPNRAEQNLTGRADMLLVWTQTVPRRLIDRRSGKDVTAKVPLIYPYTSIEHQRADLGDVQIVTRDGKVMKRIKRNAGSGTVVRQPVLSSRSAPKAQTAEAPKKAAPKSVSGKRFVQIGSFRNADNAQKAARGIARMGMPARIGKVSKGGQRYMVVQAGPFDEAGRLQQAMSRLRSAGYSDAFYR